MASNRIALRNRAAGPLRAKNADENALAKALRPAPAVGPSRQVAKDIVKPVSVVGRAALGEVTTAGNVPRKVSNGKPGLKDGKPADADAPLKRARAASIADAAQPTAAAAAPARVVAPMPARASTSAAASRPGGIVSRISAKLPARASRVLAPAQPTAEPALDLELLSEDDGVLVEALDDSAATMSEDEAAYADDAEAEDDAAHAGVKRRAWPDMPTEHVKRCRREVETVRETYEDFADVDETMLPEYADDIFEYMSDLEVEMMPNADYIEAQSEITWQMRETLVDWLLQVHLRYHMLPETLWIAVNLVDRFLSKRVVSVAKLQLVGVTAMFVASKYEEILAPSVDEFVFLCENGYSREEILKGEGIILQTLDFAVSQYCSPYSWMRKISKADDYDIQTRTLAKFITELTLLDHRFLAVKPSLVAAVGMYSARRMLGGDWNTGFIFHSGITEAEVRPGHQLIVDKLCEDGIECTAVFKKYAHKKFLKASAFAVDWARTHADDDDDDLPLAPSEPPSDGGMLYE